MGCITKLGCLFVLVLVAVGGWFTRDRWLPRLMPPRVRQEAAVATENWQPLSDAAADSTSAALKRLAQPKGQVFETLSPGAVASYIYRAAAKRLPTAADSVEASATGDKFSLRAVVPMSELGGALGPAVGIVRDRERVDLTGTLSVLQRGVASFEVTDVRIHGLPIPKGMIASLVDRVPTGARPAGMVPNALPLPIPGHIGDIRVANGKVTLYKTVR